MGYEAKSAEIFFMRFLPGGGAGDRELTGEAMERRRTVHRVSLT